SPYLCENHLEGIVLNPMDRWEVSKFTLASFSQYAFNANSFRGRDDFKKAILSVVSEDIVEDIYIFSQYFRNSRISNSLPFYLIDMLNKVDIKGIDKEVNRLFNAVQNIKNSDQKNLLESIMPWILQIEEEKILWQNFKDGYVDDVKNKIKLFNKSKHKTSANIVVKTLKKILDIKET
ncbi:beta-N-acetylglucosaminidase domain-containing protein, partial [Romboutsia ilealis]